LKALDRISVAISNHNPDAIFSAVAYFCSPVLAYAPKRAGHGGKSVNGCALASVRRKLERLHAAYEAMDGAIQECPLLAHG
jgi:hypothetical protein